MSQNGFIFPILGVKNGEHKKNMDETTTYLDVSGS